MATSLPRTDLELGVSDDDRRLFLEHAGLGRQAEAASHRTFGQVESGDGRLSDARSGVTDAVEPRHDIERRYRTGPDVGRERQRGQALPGDILNGEGDV